MIIPRCGKCQVLEAMRKFEFVVIALAIYIDESIALAITTSSHYIFRTTYEILDATVRGLLYEIYPQTEPAVL
ncbi:MAG: hypothetical protein SXA11_24660 [Cyanobacteriota bacterium]|nr:hypothetical protein [Cyanobacteriota bacterium]